MRRCAKRQKKKIFFKSITESTILLVKNRSHVIYLEDKNLFAISDCLTFLHILYTLILLLLHLSVLFFSWPPYPLLPSLYPPSPLLFSSSKAPYYCSFSFFFSFAIQLLLLLLFLPFSLSKLYFAPTSPSSSPTPFPSFSPSPSSSHFSFVLRFFSCLLSFFFAFTISFTFSFYFFFLRKTLVYKFCQKFYCSTKKAYAITISVVCSVLFFVDKASDA